jgi:hypothetical protein
MAEAQKGKEEKGKGKEEKGKGKEGVTDHERCTDRVLNVGTECAFLVLHCQA